MESKLYKVGEMAKLFHLSVSSIRHYEDLGLLAPEYISPETGYRYYSTRQFEVFNVLRYLRALDMPLSEIADFLQDRDLDKIESKLEQQKAAVVAKQQELRRIERKIDLRLGQLRDARAARLDEIEEINLPECRMIWMESSLNIRDYYDMELPISRLATQQADALVFLGKVGLGIAPKHLRQGKFERYDGIFLVLDEVDQFEGDVLMLPQSHCLRIRFRGSHPQAKESYQKLMNYVEAHNLKIAGFSREITIIDYGATSDPQQFVTEICLPVHE